MNDPMNFAKLVPGFDFLQGLVKNAGAALPGIGQWVAPTIDPAELEKRIEELRTVQFWLEQNARMLGATIQALEVQRMTLSTLKTMNVQMEDLRDSLQIRMPVMAAAPAPKPSQPVAEASPSPEDEATSSDAQPAEATAGAVDPMQWWSALTRQFTELAANAMKGGPAEAAQTMAGAMMKAASAGAANPSSGGAAVMPKRRATAAATRDRNCNRIERQDGIAPASVADTESDEREEGGAEPMIAGRRCRYPRTCGSAVSRRTITAR